MTTATATKGRERQEKILHAIFTVAGGTTRVCAYEDIVVQAWKMWPEEFGLRGYDHEYPDSSDLHKPLYGPLKREGLVRSSNKKFGLTSRGLAVVERGRTSDVSNASERGRLERDQKAEVLRLVDRPAVRMLPSPDELLDTDLYDFYGVTVRTSPGDFAGRLTAVDSAIDAAIIARDPSIELEKIAMVAATRDALKARYADLIAERRSGKSKNRSERDDA
jgi:hypothetical protein